MFKKRTLPCFDKRKRHLPILDKHNSHVTLEVVRIAIESRLDIVSSYHPHTSQALQPLDILIGCKVCYGDNNWFQGRQSWGLQRGANYCGELGAIKEAHGHNKCNEGDWKGFNCKLELDNDYSYDNDCEVQPMDCLRPYSPCIGSE